MMKKNSLNNRLADFSGFYKTARSLWRIRGIIKRNAVIAINGHNHTKTSDGDLDSFGLLFLNWLFGFRGITVTDHNSLLWGKNEKAYAKIFKNILNTSFCPGIEFSCFFDLSEFGGDRQKEFHIVGTGVNPNNKKLNSAIKNIRKGREEMTERMLEKIRDSGFSIIPFKELKKKSGGNVTLTDIAKNVKDKAGKNINVENFIGTHLLKGGDCFVPNDMLLSVHCAVEIIKASGGVVVWAHPKDTLSALFSTDFEKVALRLKDIGINGIEAFRDNHTAEDVEKIESFCINNDLEIRAGSDMHKAKDLLVYVENIVTIFEQNKKL